MNIWVVRSEDIDGDTRQVIGTFEFLDDAIHHVRASITKEIKENEEDYLSWLNWQNVERLRFNDDMDDETEDLEDEEDSLDDRILTMKEEINDDWCKREGSFSWGLSQYIFSPSRYYPKWY